MKFIFVTILLNVLAISVWSAVNGQNGFAEAAKMLRGEPAFQSTTRITGGGERTGDSTPQPQPNQGAVPSGGPS